MYVWLITCFACFCFFLIITHRTGHTPKHILHTHTQTTPHTSRTKITHRHTDTHTNTHTHTRTHIMSGGHLSKEFFELVKAIEARSKQEEDHILLTELATLRVKMRGKKVSPKQMREYLIRMIYAQMLGHDARFVLLCFKCFYRVFVCVCVCVCVRVCMCVRVCVFGMCV